MIDFNQYIGKSICINRDSYPVYLFNVREYNSDFKGLTAEQIVHSTCIIDLMRSILIAVTMLTLDMIQ